MREGHNAVATALHAARGELGYGEVEASGTLCELAKQGSRDLLDILLNCGVEVRVSHHSGHDHVTQPALLAPPHALVSTVYLQVNAKDYDARTALHLAASEGVRLRRTTPQQKGGFRLLSL